MNFNPVPITALDEEKLHRTLADIPRADRPIQFMDADGKIQSRDPRNRLVVGGNILRKPVNRQAALLLAKSSWLTKPLPDPVTVHVVTAHTVTLKPKTKKERTHRMIGAHVDSGGVVNAGPPQGDYTSTKGIRIKTINGKEFLDLEDVERVLCDQIAKLPKETRPTVMAAQDARRIINELLDGIGGDMEKFNANTKRYLEDIRLTRFAMVSETAAITKELKELRQFFLGNDYQEQITRLREFVDLCERLQKLKQVGFLDAVADTMLRLAVKE